MAAKMVYLTVALMVVLKVFLMVYGTVDLKVERTAVVMVLMMAAMKEE